jgi:hypothetical protein
MSRLDKLERALEIATWTLLSLPILAALVKQIIEAQR